MQVMIINMIATIACQALSSRSTEATDAVQYRGSVGRLDSEKERVQLLKEGERFASYGGQE